MINKNRPIKKKNFVETLEISQGASENKTNAKSIKSYTQNNREFDCIFFSNLTHLFLCVVQSGSYSIPDFFLNKRKRVKHLCNIINYLGDSVGQD